MKPEGVCCGHRLEYVKEAGGMLSGMHYIFGQQFDTECYAARKPVTYSYEGNIPLTNLATETN
jgi:hypothetical protein